MAGLAAGDGEVAGEAVVAGESCALSGMQKARLAAQTPPARYILVFIVLSGLLLVELRIANRSRQFDEIRCNSLQSFTICFHKCKSAFCSCWRPELQGRLQGD